jgi:predicted secreted protein
MKKIFVFIIFAAILFPAHSQQAPLATLVTVSGYADIKIDNDLAIVTFFIEEQDKDKSAAASRVNVKIKQGTELIKKQDKQAMLTTKGYYSYPIYSDEIAVSASQPRKRELTGWRVGQYLEMKTQNLVQLPAVAAALQKTLALNGISFGLSDITRKNFEAERLTAGFANFSERMHVIITAMGRKEESAFIESLDFDASEGESRVSPMQRVLASSSVARDTPVEQTSFDPGITTLSIRVIGKIRIK